ncbi:hypothetical protein WBJ53_08675 [Spirosoma sp. SC4-14]|uniref:hypothetical protein n=1 Tax=Spirosoma sp. SC4-14 TaxID=3128900 RepID=UPI0030CB2571
MPLSEVRALFFLLSAIAELEESPLSVDAINSLLVSVERLTGPLADRQDLFRVSNATISRLVARQT